jgi:hypothetical protein
VTSSDLVGDNDQEVPRGVPISAMTSKSNFLMLHQAPKWCYKYQGSKSVRDAKEPAPTKVLRKPALNAKDMDKSATNKAF